MRKLMNAIILPCRKATELIEKKRHCRLEGMEGIQLKMHLSMCRYCSRYFKQAALIDRLINRLPQILPLSADTSDLEERIINELPKSLK